MKVSISKVYIFGLLLLLLSCKTANIVENKNEQFYKLLDETIDRSKEVNYIGIFVIKNCDQEAVFSVNRMLYNEGIQEYKAYEYKGFPVFYFWNAENNTPYILSFFDDILKRSKYDINNFENKNQSMMEGKYAYFKNKIFIEDNLKRQQFFEKCK